MMMSVVEQQQEEEKITITRKHYMELKQRIIKCLNVHTIRFDDDEIESLTDLIIYMKRNLGEIEQ